MPSVEPQQAARIFTLLGFAQAQYAQSGQVNGDFLRFPVQTVATSEGDKTVLVSEKIGRLPSDIHLLIASSYMVEPAAYTRIFPQETPPPCAPVWAIETLEFRGSALELPEKYSCTLIMGTHRIVLNPTEAGYCAINNLHAYLMANPDYNPTPLHSY